MKPARPVRTELVLSCEHGGNFVPSRFTYLFIDPAAQAALASHRGYDIGALALGRLLSRRLQTPLLACRISRLLIDTNRSLTHRGLFSEFAGTLGVSERAKVVERYYLPHRACVEHAVARAVAADKHVLHVAVHSFTPELAGVERVAEIGLLYDPSCDGEVQSCSLLKKVLRVSLPGYRVRRNYPYRGVADGLTRSLRRQFGPSHYAGIELEINQRLIQETVPRALVFALTTALQATLQDAAPPLGRETWLGTGPSTA